MCTICHLVVAMMLEYCASDAKRCARRASVCESRGNIMAVVNVFSAFQAHVVLMAGCYYRRLLPSLHQLFDQLMYNILLLLRVQCKDMRLCHCQIALQKLALRK